MCGDGGIDLELAQLGYLLKERRATDRVDSHEKQRNTETRDVDEVETEDEKEEKRERKRREKKKTRKDSSLWSRTKPARKEAEKEKEAVAGLEGC